MAENGIVSHTGFHFPTVVKVTERGWAGHFICANRCLFRRNALLELGEQRIVVSTVGAMRMITAGVEKALYNTIGYNRYYETMAFEARWDGTYWDADVAKHIDFESPWCIDHIDHGADAEAQKMHEDVVEEVKNKMLAGTLEVQEDEDA